MDTLFAILLLLAVCIIVLFVIGLDLTSKTEQNVPVVILEDKVVDVEEIVYEATSPELLEYYTKNGAVYTSASTHTDIFLKIEKLYILCGVDSTALDKSIDLLLTDTSDVMNIVLTIDEYLLCAALLLVALDGSSRKADWLEMENDWFDRVQFGPTTNITTAIQQLHNFLNGSALSYDMVPSPYDSTTLTTLYIDGGCIINDTFADAFSVYTLALANWKIQNETSAKNSEWTLALKHAVLNTIVGVHYTGTTKQFWPGRALHVLNLFGELSKFDDWTMLPLYTDATSCFILPATKVLNRQIEFKTHIATSTGEVVIPDFGKFYTKSVAHPSFEFFFKTVEGFKIEQPPNYGLVEAPCIINDTTNNIQRLTTVWQTETLAGSATKVFTSPRGISLVTFYNDVFLEDYTVPVHVYSVKQTEDMVTTPQKCESNIGNFYPIEGSQLTYIKVGDTLDIYSNLIEVTVMDNVNNNPINVYFAGFSFESSKGITQKSDAAIPSISVLTSSSLCFDDIFINTVHTSPDRINLLFEPSGVSLALRNEFEVVTNTENYNSFGGGASYGQNLHGVTSYPLTPSSETRTNNGKMIL